MKRYLKLGLVSSILGMTVIASPVLSQAPEQATSRQTQAAELRQEREAIRSEAQEQAQSSRESAEARKAEIMNDVTDRKATINQTVCERQQTALNKRIPNLANGANTIKNTLDTMYERVAGFYESSQLTVENYQELITNVEEAKATSEAALAAVEIFEFELDCEDSQVGEQLDGFRASINEAKQSLMDYRGALVDLISSMSAEAADDKVEDEGELNEE